MKYVAEVKLSKNLTYFDVGTRTLYCKKCTLFTRLQLGKWGTTKRIQSYKMYHSTELNLQRENRGKFVKRIS